MKLNLQELEMNTTTENVDVLIENMEERMTTTGRPYVYLTIRDGYNSFHVYLWERTVAALMEDVKIGDVARVKIHKKKYRDAEGYDIRKIVKAPEEEVDLAEYVKTPNQDIGEMYEEALALISQDTVYGKLVHAIFAQYKKQLFHSGAGKVVHHDYIGGLLEHLLGVAKVCDALCSVYPDLDREMLVAGGLLHDIGKLYEMETSPVGTVSYTVPGIQVGHAILGIKIVMQTALKLGVYRTKEREMLDALIASHHGKLDAGAVTVPCFKEAMILHTADLIDSQNNMFDKEYENLEHGQMANARNFYLDATVYRP